MVQCISRNQNVNESPSAKFASKMLSILPEGGKGVINIHYLCGFRLQNLRIATQPVCWPPIINWSIKNEEFYTTKPWEYEALMHYKGLNPSTHGDQEFPDHSGQECAAGTGFTTAAKLEVLSGEDQPRGVRQGDCWQEVVTRAEALVSGNNAPLPKVDLFAKRSGKLHVSLPLGQWWE